MMKQYSVDRIIENIAILMDESGETLEISVGLLPFGIKESDILLFDGVSYQLDQEKTACKKEEVRSLIDSLFG